MCNISNELFTEKFRAKDFSKMILPKRILSEIKNGLIQNIMLYGPAGCGKSTIAGILSAPYETMKMNGSTENGIDVVRERIMTFASSMSLLGGNEQIKVIWIDECDGASSNFWNALREPIERFASNIRFVCTCNNIDKIPEPIQSRFSCIPVYPINKDESDMLFSGYVDYAGTILSKGLKISYTEEALNRFVKAYFPDMRSILNSIQTLYIKKATALDELTLSKTFDCSELFEMIVNGSDPEENYKYISSTYLTNPDAAMMEISKSFVDFVRMNYPQYIQKIPLIIITIAEYLNQLEASPDRLIVLLACCAKIQLTLK